MDADVVHLHTVADWFDVPAWLAELPKRIKVVIGMHDLWHVSGGCFVYGACERFHDKCLPCPLLHFPAKHILAANELRRKREIYRQREVRFVANSQWLKSNVAGSPVVYGAAVAVIPPPVDTRVFHILDRTQCRARLGLGPEALVVATGCASLTDKNKDTPGLLRMLRELEVPGLVVLVFGDGQISAPPGLDVRFLGKQTCRESLARIYSAADLFTSASRMETYGLTLAEAYACGCAVVAHDTGGISEALPKDASVSLVPLQDRAAFVAALSFQIQGCQSRFSVANTNRAAPCAAAPSETAGMFCEVYGLG
jgi:glycosyltransferase involved in cell wall biosynthesis